MAHPFSPPPPLSGPATKSSTFFCGFPKSVVMNGELCPRNTDKYSRPAPVEEQEGRGQGIRENIELWGKEGKEGKEGKDGKDSKVGREGFIMLTGI